MRLVDDILEQRPGLDPLRERVGAMAAKTGERNKAQSHEIRYHPYDPSQVWVKDPHASEDSYIVATMRDGDERHRPFSRETRSEARRVMEKLPEPSWRVADVMEVLHQTRAEEKRRARREMRAAASAVREADSPLKVVQATFAEPEQLDFDFDSVEPFGEFTTGQEVAQ